MESTPLLRMEKIHKWFEEVHAVNDVDFEIHRGETVLLVGDNGAGKSTLIKIISGIHQPTSGKIYFEGKKVKINSVNQARKLGIETVYQERAIVGSISVARNVFLGREPQRSFGLAKIVDSKLMKEKSFEAVNKGLGLNISSMDQEARFCSGGEQQGIAIARAFLFKSKLVILDEPTNALSMAGVKQVQKFIKELGKKGIASIIITHSLSSMFPVSDRIVIFSRGSKILDKPKSEASLENVECLLLD
ncbi:MAG: ATP-binding cassette domain-containing protein [Candidatus Bathyarchaeota archaeon]|nr:ATP-binding cassette domain-containing protein [Candidatus Bathyarchaeota archaeon]